MTSECYTERETNRGNTCLHSDSPPAHAHGRSQAARTEKHKSDTRTEIIQGGAARPSFDDEDHTSTSNTIQQQLIHIQNSEGHVQGWGLQDSHREPLRTTAWARETSHNTGAREDQDEIDESPTNHAPANHGHDQDVDHLDMPRASTHKTSLHHEPLS